MMDQLPAPAVDDAPAEAVAAADALGVARLSAGGVLRRLEKKYAYAPAPPSSMRPTTAAIGIQRRRATTVNIPRVR